MTARPHDVTARIEQWLRRRLTPGDKYHPERHYMRGPGPKYMAKLSEAQTAPVVKSAKTTKA